ncbi:recombinase family protein [Streptomyces sp. NPDC093261]|uniref:recombinase family protein n=1 Tax=Streptomyces sp. NPDC093261 TaxID=3366037 RepID=UPI0037F8FD60
MADILSPPVVAALYCRLSYAPDGSEEKVDRQEGDCRALAERLGWGVSESHVFKDNSKSAWRRDRKRKGWDALLEAIEAGEVNAILTYHGDRLMRQPYDLEKLIAAAERRGIRIASVSGIRDLDNPDDRFILRIEVAQACRESDNTSRRVKRGHVARVGKGLSTVGGFRPFGFGVQVGTKQRFDPQSGEVSEVPVYDTTQLVEAEAKLALEAAERLLAGQSQAGVIRWLNTKCTTTQGNVWLEKSFKPMITSARLAGLIEHEGQLHEAAWEGIITPEMREDILAIYRRNAEQYPHPGRSRVHLLSRVAECDICRPGRVVAKVESRRRGNPFWVYYCGECKKVSRKEEYVDAYVVGRVLAVLNDDRLMRELVADGDQPSVGVEITRLERRKLELSEQLERVADDPDIDPVLAMRTMAAYDRKIAELRDKLATTSQRRLLLRMVGISREQWERESIDARALAVKSLFRVVIRQSGRRGPGFDPDSVVLIRRPLPEG